VGRSAATIAACILLVLPTVACTSSGSSGGGAAPTRLDPADVRLLPLLRPGLEPDIDDLPRTQACYLDARAFAELTPGRADSAATLHDAGFVRGYRIVYGRAPRKHGVAAVGSTALFFASPEAAKAYAGTFARQRLRSVGGRVGDARVVSVRRAFVHGLRRAVVLIENEKVSGATGAPPVATVTTFIGLVVGPVFGYVEDTWAAPGEVGTQVSPIAKTLRSRITNVLAGADRVPPFSLQGRPDTSCP